MPSHLLPSLSLLVASFGLAGCGILIPIKVDRLRPDSSLQASINPRTFLTNKDAEVRAAVLRQLPLGSDPVRIRIFLARNFRGVFYHVRTTEPWNRRNYKHWPEGAQIYFRARDYEVFYEVSYVEIHLMLDANERLKDVIIISDAVAM